METFKEILLQHLNKYPGMRPQDCLKLLYQHHYGPGHAVTDEKQALEALYSECTELEDYEEDLLTPIGNYLVRMDLRQAVKLYTPEQINAWFVQTARNTQGSMADFMHDLKELKRSIESLPVSFSREEFDAYFAYYRSNAYPSVHHSKDYREQYHPHYRVLRVNIWNL
ncbi:MAG: hypothetical protein IKF51_01515 [Solobacterium sp.]|nr:hypothetical protein [Solobacterium sp.]